MDNLGDDFSLTTEHGVIDAKSEFALQMHFRAVRPTNVKKIVRLEVSDRVARTVEEWEGEVEVEGEGGGTPYSAVYWEAPPKRDPPFVY